MADPHASSEALSARVRVLLPLPLDTAYDYRLEASLGAGPGSFVVVPLGGRLAIGVIWVEDAADAAAVPESRLKEVAELLPAPPMAAVTQRFIDWVASYTCAPRGAVLRMAMNVPAALAAPKPRLAYRLAGPPPSRMTSARARIVELLGDGMARTAADLREAAGVGSSVIAGLVAAGTLEEVMLSGRAPQAGPDWRRPGPTLTGDQRAAAESLRGRIGQDGFSVTLLDGVTGAGKTEVYFEAIAAALEKGRQVLVLLPEIALTGQWLARFEDRFGAPPLAWHSDLKQTQRRHHWRAVAEGRARVVVGARSALFLPFTELGLIVVDEEHDGAFKQEEGVIYHARDMAVVRALLGAIPAVLVSATPSLESLVNAQNGRYHLLHLPSRAGRAALPEITAVDMRANPPPRGQWLSPALTEAITEALAAGEQALLFLNRRGYAPLTLCRACGHRLECSNCSAWLVEHRFAGRLQCHHCGYAMRLPPHCPNCDAEASFAACGPGVERLLEEVGALFPEARALVVASDTIHGPNAAAELIRRIAEREVDLVIGTQIIAKGHHFPLLTCVGVVDADLGLSGGDLRGTERTYQLLSQVAGRAGRAERPGRALLQTYMPEHPVMQALISGDRDAFLAREADARRQQGMPPFGRLVAVIVSGPDEATVSEVARALGRAAPRGPDVQVLGPAPAPLSLLRGRFRQRLLMKTPRSVNASELARRWVGQIKAPNAVRIQIDIDPYSFL